MKDYYFEEAEQELQNKRKKKKKGGFLKGFLIFISVIVVALAVFFATIKLLAPDFDFKTLIPESAQTFVKEDILRQTTTTTTTATTTTEPTTAEPTTQGMMDYMEFKEFKTDAAKEGSAIGALLNGGKVGTDYSYIYHITKKGIYRLSPESESFYRLYKSKDTLSCMNLRGDFVYFINEDDHKLYKLPKGGSAPKRIARDVKFAYVYDTDVYYITLDNSLCMMDVKKHEPTTLYSSLDDEMRLVGVSKHRVFFSVTDFNGNIKYLTVSKTDADEDVAEFREAETADTDSKLVLEHGFMYYYKPNDKGKFDVVRQKFGSDKEVTLATDADGKNYLSTDSNKLYYSKSTSTKFRMFEINMNSESRRCLMTVNDCDKTNTLKIFHGGDYDFVIGKTSENGTHIYRAGCIYTGSTNYMRFVDGKWSY
ncbi:MAG: hypothetical protein IJS03_04020 [Eubacterium sp.]|nr:hypothetical protein [Eubacterium sp.]